MAIKHPDHTFMKMAIDEAINGVKAGDGGPFGAVIVNKAGKVIASGHNMVLVNNDPTAHAEVTVIRKAAAALNNFELKGCILYTSCYPCPMCMGASLWARLDAVYWGATSADALKANFDDSAFHSFVKNPKSTVEQTWEHLPVENTFAPFALWNSIVDKTPY
uniref:CMP/dCMP-type deaminase domain-containing protein n=1 Tax=Panagrellus redivivus TaxID=6233 RepID=A0A7E4ZUB1_PANRE